MKISVSRITSKGQATIPKAIRQKLGIGAGDRIAFQVEGESVQIIRAEPLDIEFAKAQEGALADEWMSEEDEAAYGSL